MCAHNSSLCAGGKFPEPQSLAHTFPILTVFFNYSPPLQLITPFHIYFNYRMIFQRRELWRLFTNFFYFGNLGAFRFPIFFKQNSPPHY